jgi:hypothetical protein
VNGNNDAAPRSACVWPAPLNKEAHHGVFGAIVNAIAPETEADPAAILIQLLVMFSNVIGRTPKFRVGADVHHLNLFSTVVGMTSKARKGMSRNQAQHVFADVDPVWFKDCVSSGLSSGEGLIWAIRDPITRPHPIREKGRVIGSETVTEDAGVEDKRLLVVETEFASTLKVMMREGNTLSPVIRQAWDGYDLRTLTKTSATRATDPHIRLIGHVTADELRRYFEVTEAANGFGNRFLWALAKRSKELPHGGASPNLDGADRTLERAVGVARRAPELRRDAAANDLWTAVYGRLSAGRPGMLGAMTARAEAQVMRLACLYALADARHVIGRVHLEAALEVWRYCYESARWLFGDRLGDPVADAILGHLRRLWPESVTRTEISGLFQRNKPATEIDRGLALLVETKLATCEKDRSGDAGATGRAVVVHGGRNKRKGRKNLRP